MSTQTPAPFAAAIPAAPDLSGRALDGRYELHALIGEGTFGRVYRGRDRRLARSVAVKVIKPWWSEDPEWVRSFEREAQLMASVSDAGIMQIFDVGRAAEGLYYVAELVEGESLAGRLRRGPLAPREACDVAEQLCRALEHAHSQQVVHRDVKPENVLISARGRVKVGDFGIAQLAEGSTGEAGPAIVGTPRYMSPEQARGLPTCPATDVYSVGVVLYEMLVGNPPFVGSSPVEVALRHLQDDPAPLPDRIPAEIVSVVNRALSKEPGNRYPTAGAMADALARAGASARGSAQASTGRRRRAAIGADASSPSGRANGTALHDAAAGNPRPRPNAATRVAPQLTPRRNVNPSARRRTIALFGCVLALLLAMLAAPLLLSSATYVRVPALRGLSRASILARTTRERLQLAFERVHSQSPINTVVGQSPFAGVKVKQGSTLRVVLSSGPPPVKVPQLGGLSSAQATAVLNSLGLGVAFVQVPAPGTTPGVVVTQRPPTGAQVPGQSKVSLSVAETPRWRPLTSFAGESSGTSVPFRIRGTRWRVLYSMHYEGMCTFVFFCSGPSAQIVGLGANRDTIGFDLNEGSNSTRTIAGPGLYEIQVAPGSDAARWSVQVQDYY